MAIYTTFEQDLVEMKKLLLISLVVFAACTGQSGEDECTTDECLKQQAYDKVMAVHDEVMPKIGRISDLKGEIETRMKSSVDSATSTRYLELMQADESMWVWMRAFNAEVKTWPLDSALSYLQSEQEKVDLVAEKINASIAAAEEALN